MLTLTEWKIKLDDEATGVSDVTVFCTEGEIIRLYKEIQILEISVSILFSIWAQGYRFKKRFALR